MPSEKRVKEHLASLRGQLKQDQNWYARQKKSVERAKALVSPHGEMLGSLRADHLREILGGME